MHSFQTLTIFNTLVIVLDAHCIELNFLVLTDYRRFVCQLVFFLVAQHNTMVCTEMMPEAFSTCNIHTDTPGVTAVVGHTEVNSGLMGKGV